LEFKNDAPRAKVRYTQPDRTEDNGLARQGVQRPSAPIQSESTFNKGEAEKLVKEAGGNIEGFLAALEAEAIFGARKENGRWEIPESSVRTFVALTGGDKNFGLVDLTEDEEEEDEGDEA
jgi:hypothetical protein